MELLAGVMHTWRPACALVLRKMFFSAAAKTGALIRNSSPGGCDDTADYRNGLVFCQTGKSEARVELGCRRYQLCIVPSSLRLLGRYARRYGELEAGCASCPRPG